MGSCQDVRASRDREPPASSRPHPRTHAAAHRPPRAAPATTQSAPPYCLAPLLACRPWRALPFSAQKPLVCVSDPSYSLVHSWGNVTFNTMSNTHSTILGGSFTFHGTSLRVNRLGYGAMQLAGPGVFGPP